ncbi:hypothetical protein NQ315_003340 [Exocentrus adspersus]|uniref:Integrase zinc-binding domain-containing protein n=1 Tax=Exocentrus adspersus TaxID=1586481 RepID=A0AAV8V7U7_9CUCU|nr:hypothetical protein NQ315_003340 [Exocentrus adspersus]
MAFTKEQTSKNEIDEPEEWHTVTLTREQGEDPDVGDGAQWKIEGKERPTWQEISDRSSTFKGYWIAWQSPDGKEKNYQTVLPQKRVPEVLHAVHVSGIGGGHFGINKALDKVGERFYWLGSRSDGLSENSGQRKANQLGHLYSPNIPISLPICSTRVNRKDYPASVKLKLESDRMKTLDDLRVNTYGFQVGTKVWLYNPKRTRGKSPKLPLIRRKIAPCQLSSNSSKTKHFRKEYKDKN